MSSRGGRLRASAADDTLRLDLAVSADPRKRPLRSQAAAQAVGQESTGRRAARQCSRVTGGAAGPESRRPAENAFGGCGERAADRRNLLKLAPGAPMPST